MTADTILAEGKTKIIHSIPGDDNHVAVLSKDDITAGNGRRHDVVPGKGEFANRTTCNVFYLLKKCGIPVAFDYITGLTVFFAEKCTMLPYEVVVRAEAHGSYLKRHPELQKGQVLQNLVVELFLKTTGKKWKHHDLACDDPLMQISGDGIHLFLPDTPLADQTPFLTLAADEVFTQPDEPKLLSEMGRIALRTFSILKTAWGKLGCNMVDFKVEFGVNTKGELRLADVIDNDSWRLVMNGKYLDKQTYRDGDEVGPVMTRYKLVADLSDNLFAVSSGG